MKENNRRVTFKNVQINTSFRIKQWLYITIVAVLNSLVLTQSVLANSETQHGFLDFNAYPYLSDVDNDSVFTLNIGADLGNRFSYFSLLNTYNQQNDNELGDTTTFYTEQNLRWKISADSPLDLTFQSNLRSGENNDRHRLGFRWRLSDTEFFKDAFDAIHLTYAINFHLVQFDHDPNHVWQMEHSFFLRAPELSDRLYLAGFIDHTFNETLPENIPDNPVVMEAQLGYRLTGGLFAVAEWRLNQYRRTDVNNLAIGLQYKHTW